MRRLYQTLTPLAMRTTPRLGTDGTRIVYPVRGMLQDLRGLKREARTLAYVWVGDRFVNGEIIRRGVAHAYRWEPNVKYARQFVDLQRRARAEKLGIWALPAPAPCDSYVGSTRDHAFHRPDCPTARRYPIERRRVFQTREEAYDELCEQERVIRALPEKYRARIREGETELIELLNRAHVIHADRVARREAGLPYRM